MNMWRAIIIVYASNPIKMSIMSNGSQNQCQNKIKIGSADINVGLTRCTSTARNAVTLPGINEIPNSFEADSQPDTQTSNSDNTNTS